MAKPSSPPSPLRRRQLLAGALAAVGMLAASALQAQGQASPGVLLENITRLYPVRVARIVAPQDAAQLSAALASWPGQVCVGGGRFSMGGQIGVEGGLHLDMRRMNALVWLRPEAMAVRVQAGMCWRDLQDLLDPLDLSVHTMQSYANFTVGGSVSVNAHGRYVGHGPIAGSVRALQIMSPAGRLVEASREHCRDWFAAALGGYGGVGIVTEVELALERNCRIERSVAQVRRGDYPGFFRARVQGNADCMMHNADLLPPLFDTATAVSWSRTDKLLTVPDRLVARGRRYALEQTVMWALTELPRGQKVYRDLVHPALFRKPAVVWRNYEASLDVASLEPHDRALDTYQRHATRAQFEAAYPQAQAFRRIKARIDPGGRMMNELWRQYL
ncbi:MAG TPA: FAD-binding protein [Ramlibacter sp.]|nr:FAD-binding protein [Ramlibacter sp.]